MDRWIESDPKEFLAKLNRKSFQVAHHLSDHSLFQLPELMKLAKRTSEERPNCLYYDLGTIRVDQRWDQTPKANFSIDEVLDRIENCGAWIILKHVQRDPIYRVLLDRGMAELKGLAGQNLDPLIKQEDILIFITSPKRITSYHIDRECNWILQIHGSKTLHVFDRDDKEVLPEAELECFWAKDNNAAVYKPQFQDRAASYQLAPGVGVHIPVNAPHWVENHDNVSVSLSVNFQFKDSKRANLYRANYWLRRIGMHPATPGQGPWRDFLKNGVMTGATRLRRLLQGQNSPW
jgi:hypothetical protein